MSEHYETKPSNGFPENKSEYAVKWPEQYRKEEKANIAREYPNDTADDISQFRPKALED